MTPLLWRGRIYPPIPHVWAPDSYSSVWTSLGHFHQLKQRKYIDIDGVTTPESAMKLVTSLNKLTSKF